MSDQQVKRYIVSRHGMEDADAANEYGQTKLGKHEALMVMADDFSRTDAARVEAERKVAEWERDLASYREQWNAVAVENQRLAARVAELERVEQRHIDTCRIMERDLRARIASLESDLARARAEKEKLLVALHRVNDCADKRLRVRCPVCKAVIADALAIECATCGGSKTVPAMIETATGMEACPYLGEPCPDCDSARSATHSEGKV